jgi:hypothetical protein
MRIARAVDGAVGPRYGEASLISSFSTFLRPYLEKIDILSVDARR